MTPTHDHLLTEVQAALGKTVPRGVFPPVTRTVQGEPDVLELEIFVRATNPALTLLDREMPHLAPSKVTFTYTNHRNHTSIRTAIPLRLFWGSNTYHPEPQWLLEAHDLDKNEHRTFALKDMRP